MKKLLSKIDKIGLIFFSLILFALIYEFSHIDFSVEQNIHWRFYIFLLCSFLVIFRSIWIKFASLLVGLLVISSAFSFLINIQFGTLVHHLYSQGISFWELFPFLLLIAVTIYNLYVILVDLLIERKKKINLK
jgi:hypothetical protein